MFKTIPWTPDLDLSNFYATAEARGFKNNSSQKLMVDCFNNEQHKQVWILYYNDSAIGSVAAHSFDDVMGPNTFRIAARTCVFTDMIDGTYGQALRTTSVITRNQNPTAQFLIPTCIEWCPKDSRMYITSNENIIGTQRKVHNIFGPLMQEQGMMKRIKEIEYRGSVQTIWELYPEKFYEILNKYPRWR